MMSEPMDGVLAKPSRFDYVKYDEFAQRFQDEAKTRAIMLEGFIECLPPGRAKSLALTCLEECYMWIGKAIRDGQLNRQSQAEASASYDGGRLGV